MLGMVDFSLIPVYVTEQVKLLHGSASLAESAGALGGTIQLENKADWSNKLSGKLLTGYGSFHTLDEFVQLNIGNHTFQSKSSFFYNASKNDFSYLNKLNANLDPVTGAYIYPTQKNTHADYINYGLLQEFYLQTASNQTLSLKTWLQHNERSIPQLLTNESNEAANSNRQKEDALRSVMEWKRYGNQSRLSILSAINLQNSAYRLENSVSGSSNLVVIDSEAKILSYVNKIGFNYQFSPSFSLQTGMEVNFYSVNSENRQPNGIPAGYDQTRTENSLFGKLETTFGGNWSAVFLVREELIDWRQEALLPLLRLSYRPDPEKSLVVSGSVARNSHPPTLNDLYFLPGGNPLLKSETGAQYDLNFTEDFTFGNSQLHAGLSLFHSDVKNWIIWLPTFQGYWEPTNIVKVTSSGLEANGGWNGQFRSIRYSLKGNYAFCRTLNRSEASPAYGKQLPYIPEHSANVNLHLSCSSLYIDWMWNYYSKRYTTTANSEEISTDYLYPYFMNNFQIGMSMPLENNKLTAEFKIQNIFNEDYRTVLQRPMPGRNYQIVLRYDF
jgi:iron complex outermembrane receptor protein